MCVYVSISSNKCSWLCLGGTASGFFSVEDDVSDYSYSIERASEIHTYIKDLAKIVFPLHCVNFRP